MAKCKNCKHLCTMQNYKKESYKWCSLIDDCPQEDIERCCENYAPMTNADRIRSMTDEELSSFIVRNKFNCEDYCEDARWGCASVCHKYDKAALVWLQKESEEQ